MTDDEVDGFLVGVTAKIERAEEHLRNYVTEAAAWGERQLYRVVCERNADATRYTTTVIFDESPPTLRWSLMLGDALHDLRCALDHVVYALAVAESGAMEPPAARRLQFVITENEADFAEARGRIKTLSDDAQAAIERLQPYNRPHATHRQPLLLLNELNNRDKHRLLHVAVVRPVAGDVTLKFPELPPGVVPEDLPMTIDHRIGDLENGAPVLTINFGRPTPGVEMNVEVSMNVSVRHAPGLDGSQNAGIDWVIKWIRDEVREVVTSLRPLFSRH